MKSLNGLCVRCRSYFLYLVLIILPIFMIVMLIILCGGGGSGEFSTFELVNRLKIPLESHQFLLLPSWKIQNQLTTLSPGLKNKTNVTVAAVGCGNVQLVINMLKTAVLFSHDVNLHIIIFTDEDTMPLLKFNMIALLQGARAHLGLAVTYEIHKASFPDTGDGTDWRQMHLTCTNQRLFFPSLLPHIDSLIYLDTDTLVMGNLSEFWNEFSRMDEFQLAAATQNHEYLHHASIYNPSRGHPYFGPRGLNAGIMLMNLTRMRAFQFEKKAVEMYKIYRKKITLADQDILNILFHEHPKFLMTLSCIYNFFWIHCPWKTLENYGQQRCRWWHDEEPVCFCHDIYSRGVYIIHGNYGTFFKTQDNFGKSLFPWIYSIWQRYRFGDSLDELLLKMALHYKKYSCFMSGRHLIKNAHAYFMNLNLLQK